MTATPRHRGDCDGDDREYDCDRRLPPRRPVKAREQTSQAGVRQRVAGDPSYVLKPPTQPELVRISRQQYESDCDGGDERQSSDDCLTTSPGCDEKDNEERGSQLDTGGDPNTYPSPPAGRLRQHVSKDDRHNEHIDLAELQRKPDWFEPEDRSHQKRRQPPHTGCRP